MCNLMNLMLDFIDGTLTISQSVLHRVLFSSLVVDHFSMLLYCMYHGNSFNSQLSTDFLKFIKLSMAFLLAFLHTGGSLL